MEKELAQALQNYVLLVSHLQRKVNPEEWESHGDWNRLQAEAKSVLNKFHNEERYT